MATIEQSSEHLIESIENVEQRTAHRRNERLNEKKKTRWVSSTETMRDVPFVSVKTITDECDVSFAFFRCLAIQSGHFDD